MLLKVCIYAVSNERMDLTDGPMYLNYWYVADFGLCGDEQATSPSWNS